MSRSGVYELPAKHSGEPIVLVTSVGEASGSLAAAAALACAGSEPERAGMLIDLGSGRPPRPAPIATAGARGLEERLAVHLPEAVVASRGGICRLHVPVPGQATEEGAALDTVAAALPLARESIAVVHLPPALLQPALADSRLVATAALLRAELPTDRALTALVARDLIDRGLKVGVLKRPLPLLPARGALFGLAIPGIEPLPPRFRGRLLS